MTEETRNAAMSGPIGIIMAIGVSAILGWFLLLSLLFSIQDYDTTVASATGQPVTQIFLDTVGEKGAIVLMVGIILSSDWYARSDDGSWQVIIIGAMFFCGFILGLPSLGSSVAFAAAMSIATIGLYISYGTLSKILLIS